MLCLMRLEMRIRTRVWLVWVRDQPCPFSSGATPVAPSLRRSSSWRAVSCAFLCWLALLTTFLIQWFREVQEVFDARAAADWTGREDNCSQRSERRLFALIDILNVLYLLFSVRLSRDRRGRIGAPTRVLGAAIRSSPGGNLRRHCFNCSCSLPPHVELAAVEDVPADCGLYLQDPAQFHLRYQPVG